ncbi:Hypp3572 [Branchiostoma lanceolatum]|uniref:Hypp3572 protein n=1 Tax=Branchiostoma lanceolatum TaxID=7740 RepID=A0A8K0ES82_BRALA|nr:Hypp3572 [Branchiostoma lanceolatum]
MYKCKQEDQVTDERHLLSQTFKSYYKHVLFVLNLRSIGDEAARAAPEMNISQRRLAVTTIKLSNIDDADHTDLKSDDDEPYLSAPVPMSPRTAGTIPLHHTQRHLSQQGKLAETFHCGS